MSESPTYKEYVSNNDSDDELITDPNNQLPILCPCSTHLIKFNLRLNFFNFSDKKGQLFRSLRKSIEALKLPGFVEVNLLNMEIGSIIIYFQIVCNFQKILAIEVRFHYSYKS